MKPIILLLLPAFWLVTGLISPVWAVGVYDLPALTSGSAVWVVDQGEAISRATEGEVTNTLKNLAEQTGQEVRIVVVRRLDYDETINSLADQLFSSWFPTTDDQNNQTLVVLDSLTNNVTLRRGEGTKSLLEDEVVTSIVEETIGYPLKDGNKYNQAVIGAGDRLTAILSGQEDPGPPEIQEVTSTVGTFTPAEETDSNATLWIVGLLLAATVIPMATYFFYVGFSN